MGDYGDDEGSGDGGQENDLSLQLNKMFSPEYALPTSGIFI